MSDEGDEKSVAATVITRWSTSSDRMEAYYLPQYKKRLQKGAAYAIWTSGRLRRR